MTYALAALAILAVAYLWHRKRRKPNTGWRFDRWTKDVTLHVDNGLPWFNFPATGGVGYLQLRNPPKLAGTVRVRFTVTGDGFTPTEYPVKQATVSLIIQRKGDDWTAAGPMEAYRYYSRQVVKLEAGTHEMAVPLTVEHWGGVNGSQDPAQFAATLRDADSIGLCFGSAGGRGHGVYATQSSKFTLDSLMIE